MRSARKLRRIYVFTVAVWCLSLFVLWIIRSLNVITGDAISLSDYDPEPNVTHLILFALGVVVLIVALVIETLIFGKRNIQVSGVRPNEFKPTLLEPHFDTLPSRVEVSTTDFR